MYLTIQAIVLRVTDYNDRDALLTVLSRNHGKLTIKARGLRRKNSPLTHPAGPTGVIMMDYAGVDKSGKYDVKGLQVVQAIINNNFNYLNKIVPTQVSPEGVRCYYSLTGAPLAQPQPGINIVREADGTTRKVLY